MVERISEHDFVHASIGKGELFGDADVAAQAGMAKKIFRHHARPSAHVNHHIGCGDAANAHDRTCHLSCSWSKPVIDRGDAVEEILHRYAPYVR